MNKKKSSLVRKKTALKRAMVNALDIPAEVALDVPRIIMTGNYCLTVENHKGIIDYDLNRIRIKIGGGWVEVIGSGLTLQTMCSEELVIEGKIQSLNLETGL